MTQIPDHYGDVGDGWKKILADLHLRLLNVDSNYEVAQVKEKFGRLRVYLEKENQEIWQLIADAEDRSGKTCEVCGGNGYATSKGTWMLTRCRSHDPKREVEKPWTSK